MSFRHGGEVPVLLLVFFFFFDDMKGVSELNRVRFSRILFYDYYYSSNYGQELKFRVSAKRFQLMRMFYSSRVLFGALRGFWISAKRFENSRPGWDLDHSEPRSPRSVPNIYEVKMSR